MKDTCVCSYDNTRHLFPFTFNQIPPFTAGCDGSRKTDAQSSFDIPVQRTLEENRACLKHTCAPHQQTPLFSSEHWQVGLHQLLPVPAGGLWARTWARSSTRSSGPALQATLGKPLLPPPSSHGHPGFVLNMDVCKTQIGSFKVKLYIITRKNGFEHPKESLQNTRKYQNELPWTKN